jgi:phospholipid transport system transporter-binding protein
VNAAPCDIARDGETVRFRGPLLRHAVAGLWKRLAADTAGIRRLDLSAVESIDSAGLALISLLATRSGGVAIEGHPEGFAELRNAYRLGHDLTFARD